MKARSCGAAGVGLCLLLLVLVLGAGTASAWRVDMVGDVGHLQLGDRVAVDILFDSEGAADLVLLSFGVQFDDTVLAYDQVASSTTSYLLYSNARTPYLKAYTTCGGGYGQPTSGDGCNLFPTPPTRVQMEFLSSQAIPLLVGVPQATNGQVLLGQLVFEAVSPASGVVEIEFLFDVGDASILLLGDGSEPPLTLGEKLVLNVIGDPPPGVPLLGAVAAGLCGAAIVGIGFVGLRGRR